MLQGYNGTLTMLDGRNSSAGMQESGQAGYGSDNGVSGGAKGGSAKGGFDKQLDDEIPF